MLVISGETGQAVDYGPFTLKGRSTNLRRCHAICAGVSSAKARAMAFLVNSAPRAGFRFEPGLTFSDVYKALEYAVALSRRGMRAIKIRDTESGQIFDERGLRAYINGLKAADQI